MKQAVYLKINRTDKFAIENLSRWIDYFVLTRDIDIYINCDNDDLIKTIKEEILLSDRCEFIQSEKSNRAKRIISNIIYEPRWYNAGYAHLTTFLHSADNHYDSFWNIDADDTQMFLSPDRVLEVKLQVENYAKNNNIAVFSLDMWPTVKKKLGYPQWSFGVTYTDGSIDWLNLFYNYGGKYKAVNIDGFFTLLRQNEQITIESFYVENMKYIHYSNDIHSKPINSYLYHWKDGKLFNPYLYYFLDLKELGQIDIAEEVIKIDIGITDDETKVAQLHNLFENVNYNPYLPYKYKVNDYLFVEKLGSFAKQNGIQENRVILWGAGECFRTWNKSIRNVLNIKYISDNNENIWGECIEGLQCITPDKIKSIGESVVFVMVYSVKVANAIKSQLNDMGISNVYTFPELYKLFG